MKITKVILGEQAKLALVFPVAQYSGFTFNKKFNTNGNAAIFYGNDTQLIKLEKIKYRFIKNPVKWTLRELVKKTFFINMSMAREARNYRIVQKLGFKTPKLYAWGVFIGPHHEYTSFLIIDKLIDHVTLKSLTTSDSTDDKRLGEQALYQLNEQLNKLQQHGYTHRDFHLDNFMVCLKTHNIIWLDIQLKKT